MEPHDQGKGGLKRKVATGVAVGLATTAAVGVARKLLGKHDGDDSAVESAGERGKQAEGTATRSAGTASRRTTGSKRSTSTGSRRNAKAGSRNSRNSREPTKEQLYARAKRLAIPGRSNMTKAQLERAIERAK